MLPISASVPWIKVIILYSNNTFWVIFFCFYENDTQSYKELENIKAYDRKERKEERGEKKERER